MTFTEEVRAELSALANLDNEAAAAALALDATSFAKLVGSLENMSVADAADLVIDCVRIGCTD